MQILSELSQPFLSACSKLPSARRMLVSDKATIYAERPLDKCYVVKKGYVRLVSIQPDGRIWTRMVFGQGALIGDLPFRPGHFLSSERAIASGPASLIEVDRQELESESSTEQELRLLLLKTLSAQLQFVDRRMQWQLISPLRTRIAAVLADLMCFAGARCGHGHLVDVRLTHEEFSQFVIAARPAVSEVLREFKSSGAIDYTRSHLCLLNMDELLKIAGAD